MDVQELHRSWQYFLSIEKDLDETTRYIEPVGQSNTYSFEFYKIITLGCSEIEAAFKMICKVIDVNSTCGNMGEYKKMILTQYPKICAAEVRVPRWGGKTIRPFENWDKDRLKWWDSHQDVKHSRFESIQSATYDNAVYTLAGLYILLLYLYKITGNECPYGVSICFFSEYCYAPLFCNRPSELPDFSE